MAKAAKEPIAQHDLQLTQTFMPGMQSFSCLSTTKRAVAGTVVFGCHSDDAGTKEGEDGASTACVSQRSSDADKCSTAL